VRVGRGGSVREAYRARDREVAIGDSVKGIIHGKSVLVRYDPNLSQEGMLADLSGSWYQTNAHQWVGVNLSPFWQMP
jgi:hypothetical protein